MDVIKVALEIVIVGILALPWLVVMIDLILPTLLKRAQEHASGLLDVVPKEFKTPVLTILIFSLTYFIGAMFVPLADDVLDDPDWFGTASTGEIRYRVLCSEQNAEPSCSNTTSFRFGSAHSERQRAITAVTNSYHSKETAALRAESPMADRLKQLQQEIIVLRGGTFSAVMLLLLCFLGLCGQWKAKLKTAKQQGLRTRMKRGLAFLPSLMLISLACYYIASNWFPHARHDVDFADLFILQFALIGLSILLRDFEARPYINGWVCISAGFFAFLAYTGWFLAQTAYTEQVVYSALP